jgi:hypothetical protein
MPKEPNKSKATKPPKPPLQRLGPGIHMKHGISLKQERLIGRVIVSWSKLEAIMQDVIWVILDVGLEDGRILTARMNAITKLRWLRSFAKRHVSGENLESLQSILDTIEVLQDDRNFIVHASWGTMIKNGEPAAMSLRQKSEPHEIITETFPDWRMHKIIADIVSTRDELISWRKQQESLPDRRTPRLYED